MPSLKSYRNRKADIVKLNGQLAEAEYQLRKSREEFRIALFSRDAEINRLYVTLRLYREYILRAYDPDAADLIAIPSCLKPFDALTYVEEKRYGPDHKS